MVVIGVLSAFALYMLTNVIHALGLGGNLPVILAGWTPACVSLALSATLLMHFEDG